MNVPEGYRIVWKHWRLDERWWRLYPDERLYANHPELIRYRHPHTFTPAPYGGYTECNVYNADWQLVASDYALCSIKDQFVYKIGRQISLGRALKQLRDTNA